MAEENTVAKLTEQLEAEKAKNKTLSAAAEKSNKVIADLQAQLGQKPKKSDMEQYAVLQTCYWNNTLFRENDIADIPKGVTPPDEYFKKIG